MVAYIFCCSVSFDWVEATLSSEMKKKMKNGNDKT